MISFLKIIYLLQSLCFFFQTGKKWKIRKQSKRANFSFLPNRKTKKEKLKIQFFFRFLQKKKKIVGFVDSNQSISGFGFSLIYLV
ncbi:hypothetical protein L6452_43203 [Arctium lappa]|uniref:Uncharacterized protein n=1 Tax=Arctium lappa TaxID=4217 RepID=A0ACB8XKB1_ARCLA|nr:hypothetical protein L6452_43203 [Arctium lappa]